MQYSNTARESFERFLADDNEENGAKPTAAGTLMRCSDAGNCLRQRGFAAAKFTGSEKVAPSKSIDRSFWP